METAASEGVATNCDSTLEDYQNTLEVTCEGDESEAAILTWTPDENTPDVVFYQVNVYSITIPAVMNVFCTKLL